MAGAFSALLVALLPETVFAERANMARPDYRARMK
jgi:hypothetical protein